MGLSCRLLGHRVRFGADGPVMRWSCERGCGLAGEKTYASAADARRYAAAFDRDDRRDIGRRAPFLGMFPLRIWYSLARRRSGDQARSKGAVRQVGPPSPLSDSSDPS